MLTNNGFAAEKTKDNSLDWLFVAIVVGLAGFGMAMQFSASHYFAQNNLEVSPYYFLFKHLIFMSIGFLAMLVFSRLPLEIIKNRTPAIYVITALLMLACFIPAIGKQTQGGTRWLSLAGFSFQPSELAKLTLVLYLAQYISKREAALGDSIVSVFPALLVCGSLIAIIVMQNDFSTAFFAMFLTMTVFLVSRLPWRHLTGLTLITLPLMAIALFSRPHRLERLLSYFWPHLDPDGSGYQVNAAYTALQKGGFWGVGFGQGTQKLGRLPEVHSDFVFASLAEELGFVGVLLTIFLFALLAYRGYTIAFECRDRYNTLLGFALTTAIFYQALVNIAVVVRLIPTTGIPLPFFSAGGSSLLIVLSMSGLLLNLDRQNQSNKAGR